MPENGISKTKSTASDSSIQSVQSAKVKQSPRSLDSLLQWLLSQEATISKVVEKTVPGTTPMSPEYPLIHGSGRGLFSSEDIEEGELLIRIPETCLINLETLAPLQAEYPTLKELSAHQQLTIFLLLESVNGEWGDYILSLPSFHDFSGMPLTWTEEWTAKLPPASKYYFQQESLAPYTHDINSITHFLESQNLTIPSSQILLHAWLCVNTRCVYYHHPDLPAHHKDNMTLAPLIDMINHHPMESVTVSRVNNALEIKSAKRIPRGEELGFSYHSATSRFWVCEYGFHLPWNDYDDLDLSVEIERLVEGLGGRGNLGKEWLEREGYWGEYTISSDGEVSFRIQVALRMGIGIGEAEVRGFMLGERDGSEEQDVVDGALRTLLEEKIAECETVLKGLRGEGIEGRIIRTLWEEELHIATTALKNLA